jgi:NADH-quinone oxidoreductase subunit N
MIEPWFSLAPDLLVFGLVAFLMLLETFRVDRRWGHAAFVAGLVGALALLWQPLVRGDAFYVVQGELGVDGLASAGKGVLLLCGLAMSVAFRTEWSSHKAWILAASSLLGGMLMLGSGSFATLFIGIEMLSLPAFALIVLGQGKTVASEGAFKYLVLSSVASALFLFGASLAYGLTGSLRLDAFGSLFAAPGLQAQAAILLVASGLFLKAAVFPFHAWAPDAYAAARLPVTAWMASVIKAAVVLAIVRVFGPLPLTAPATMIIGVLAIVSIIYGNLAALGQLRFKRLLAYSSVAHAGYMIFALLDITGSRAHDLLLYTVFYGLATVIACACFAALCPGDDDRIERLDGRFAARPVTSVLLALAMLSLAGVPPLPGFFAKVFLFKSVIVSGHVVGAIVAFTGSFLGLAYYASIAMRMFRAPERPAADVAATRAEGRAETIAG